MENGKLKHKLDEAIKAAPVHISQPIEPSEHQYQNPPLVVFDWKAIAGVKEENVANFFTSSQVQDQLAASFFENICAPPAIPQIDSFYFYDPGYLNSEFKCNVQKVLSSKPRLKEYKMSHTGTKPFYCKTCGNNYATQDSLKQHFMKKHEEGWTGYSKPHQ